MTLTDVLLILVILAILYLAGQINALQVFIDADAEMTGDFLRTIIDLLKKEGKQ